MTEMWYDDEEDVLGIMLKNKNHWRGVEVGDSVILDLAKDGEIVGVEIFGLKKAFKNEIPLMVSKALARKR